MIPIFSEKQTNLNHIGHMFFDTKKYQNRFWNCSHTRDKIDSLISNYSEILNDSIDSAAVVLPKKLSIEKDRKPNVS